MKLSFLPLLLALLLLPTARPAAAQWTEVELLDASNRKALNIQFVRAHDGRLYAGSFNQGLFRSDDDGATWSPVNEGLDELTPRDLAFYGDAAYVVLGGRGVYRSADHGATWTPPGTGLPAGFPAYTAVWAFDGSVFAGTASNHQVFGVWRSDDAGATWQAVGDVTVPHAVYAFVDHDGALFAGTNRGVYRSHDKGETWTKLENGIPGNSVVYRLLRDGDTVYAAAADAVYRTVDQGETWTWHNDGFPSFPQPSGLAVRAGYLFTVVVRLGRVAGSAYVSPADVVAWADRGDNLADQMNVLLGADATHVYAGADNGLWRRPLADFGVSTVDREVLDVPAAFRLEQNYPNPFNPSTAIRFTVPEAAHVTLKVYDALGRLRATLLDGPRAPGAYEVPFSAAGLPSGRYLYRLEAGRHVEARVMTLVE